jgi:hypothetical protein
MMAFCVVTPEYSELAAITVPAFEWATGLSVTVVSEVDASFGPEAPYAAKLTLPDAEQYVFFDADLLFLRQFELPELEYDEFAAVPAQKYERDLRAVVDAYGGDPKKFVNTGLFIASAAHRPAMRLAAQWMQEGISCLHEESVLNCALQSTGARMRRLPLTLNQQIITSMNRTGFHLCGQRGIEAKLREARYLVRTFAPPELRKLLGLTYGPQQEQHAVT